MCTRPVDFSIHCFGSFEVFAGERRLVLPRHRKTDALLEYLVLRRHQRVSREVLMAMGWPEEGRESANNTLHTTISALRHQLTAALPQPLEGSPLLIDDGHYYLNPGLSLQVDVEDFDRLYRAGLALEREGRETEAQRAFEEGATLYRGDLYIDDLQDVSLVIERERLAFTHLSLLARLADYALRRADHTATIDYGFQILSRDPCREDGHVLLMRSFSRLGQRVQALRQYELCRDLLKRELGIEPAPEILLLRDRIMQCEDV